MITGICHKISSPRVSFKNNLTYNIVPETSKLDSYRGRLKELPGQPAIDFVQIGCTKAGLPVYGLDPGKVEGELPSGNNIEKYKPKKS